MIDWMAETARRVHGLPDGWGWCIADAKALGGDFIALSGTVPTETYKRGPRKGHPKWPAKKDLETFPVSRRQIMETRRAYEADTGKCANCEGSGKEMAGWSVEEGRRERDCSSCGGTGKPREQGDD